MGGERATPVGTSAADRTHGAPTAARDRVEAAVHDVPTPLLVEIDVKLDRAIVKLRDALQAHAGSGDIDEPEPALARKMLDACFPRGVQALTQTTHVEEFSLVDALLGEIKKHHAESVKQLGLGAFVQRVGKLNEEYRAAQHASPPAAVDFSQVRAARQRGQEFLLEVVAMIMGRFLLPTTAHVAARQALLGPLLRQNEAIRAYLRSRRAMPDVDPETGESQEPAAIEPAVVPDAPPPAVLPDASQPVE